MWNHDIHHSSRVPHVTTVLYQKCCKFTTSITTSTIPILHSRFDLNLYLGSFPFYWRCAAPSLRDCFPNPKCGKLFQRNVVMMWWKCCKFTVCLKIMFFAIIRNPRYPQKLTLKIFLSWSFSPINFCYHQIKTFLLKTFILSKMFSSFTKFWQSNQAILK